MKAAHPNIIDQAISMLNSNTLTNKYIHMIATIRDEMWLEYNKLYPQITRDMYKNLMNRIFHGGSFEAWLHDYNLSNVYTDDTLRGLFNERDAAIDYFYELKTNFIRILMI